MAPFQNNPKPWMSLCGPSLNMSMMTSIKEWNGPIQMQFLSQNVQSSIKGHLKEGYLTLSDPFYFQMQLTSQMSDIFFKSIESISYLRSTAPITLTIQPEGFVLPVKGFDMSQIQMSTGRLEIGQLEAKNEGSLQTALGILKMGQYRPGEIVPLWFAPLDFTIREGQMNCERTELLIADSLQVCLWGRINLQTDSVDAIFGLTSSCLDQAFGIKDLPKDYVLQIPVRGTLADLQVNKSKATAKIGTLLLWQQRSAAAGLVKGPGGAILGEIMSKIGPIPGGNEKAPPAKRPFPWEATHPKPSKNKTGYLSEDKDRVENRNRKLIKPSDSAIKQALKLIR
jgi:hypothetical protein